MELMKQADFFQKYDISQSQWKNSRLKWSTLEEIFKDYITLIPKLAEYSTFISNHFSSSCSVHSIRSRIKDPEHLIEKIIRKAREDKRKKFTVENYRDHIDDLIGIRALHLFKSEWRQIDKFIRNNYNLVTKPVANIRKGDSDQLQEDYRTCDCEIKIHPYGYRSIHYIVEATPTKETFKTEIQVRTVFEEGWSEIDHQLRYPYDQTNPVLVNYLSILNSLCGCADEMASFITKFYTDWRGMESSILEQESQINELEEEIQKLEIDAEKKSALIKSLKDVRETSTASNTAISSTLSKTLAFGGSYAICRKCNEIAFDIGDDGICRNCSMRELLYPESVVGGAASLGLFINCPVCGKPKSNSAIPEFYECNCPFR